MYIGVISMRYAKALLAYADEKGTEDTVYEEAGILADSFSRIPELRQALDNPVPRRRLIPITFAPRAFTRLAKQLPISPKPTTKIVDSKIEVTSPSSFHRDCF